MSKDAPRICQSVFADTLAELSYLQYEAAARRGALVLVPVAVVEEHGPHLPLGTDVYGAHVLCVETRDRLSQQGVEALIAPPVYWGVNAVTSAFPGSFRVRPEVFADLLHDVLQSLLDDGFPELYIVNHHGDADHNRIVRRVLTELQAEGAGGVRWPQFDDLIERIGASPGERIWVRMTLPAAARDLRMSGELGVHAHELETALVDRYQPDLVDRDALARLRPTALGNADLQQWRRGGEHARHITPDGYFGDPHPHDPELWRYYELRAEAIAAAIASERRGEASR